jgi:HEPN domain-containing protein/uncharacterized protein (UPF0147 family)
MANTNVKTAYWIKLALSDLKSSKALYAKRHYRTSYFLFQQAAEKANKAFALYGGLATEEELSKIGHDQFKLYRKSIVKQQAELKHFTHAIEMLPERVRDHEMTGLNAIHSVHTGQIEIIKFIDSLRNKDLVNILAVELNHLYKLLIALRKPDFKLPRNSREVVKAIISNIADWAGNFETPEATTARKELEEMGNDPGKSKEMYKIMIQILRLTMDFAFVFYSFCCCALLTVQHSSLTRYPAGGKDPLNIYTIKLPLVKKQLLFMDLLQDAIRKLQKMNK